MKKRILSILLICCMVFSLFPVSALAANSDMPFTDVKTTDWFYDEVCYVYEHGLMQGTSATTFDPDETTSRGMIVTILYRLEGEPSFTNANIFTDVVPDSWYEKAVVWANGKSIVEGYGDGKFGPDDPITREQLATIMYRYANYKGYDTAAKADLSDFVDSGKISSYALDAMKWANAAGLINGIGASKLDPQGDADRAQTAAILMRFCEKFVTEKTYTVTFDLNYGSNSTYTTQDVKNGELAVRPIDPIRSGYTFAGWYKDAGCTDDWDFATDEVTANTTLYAKWKQMTIGDILATVEEGFPAGDINVPPSNAWVCGENRAYRSSAILVLRNVAAPESTWTYIPLNTTVEVDNGFYKASTNDYVMTFNMVEDKLISFVYETKSEDPSADKYDGTYAPPVSVTGVTLDKSEVTLTVGDEDVKLTATVLPDNATDKAVTWTSSEESVATVDDEGNVHAVAAGTATITVTTVDGNKTATCEVTVAAPEPILTPVDAPVAATGLIYNGQEQTGVAEAAGYTVTNGKATDAGSYTATVTLAEGYKWSDDTTAAKQIDWSIAKAALTATADEKTVTVGDVAPEYTVTYTGWVNGESIDTVEPTTAAELSCGYTTSSPAGDYDITFTTAPVFANYDVTTVKGKLTAAPVEMATVNIYVYDDTASTGDNYVPVSGATATFTAGGSTYSATTASFGYASLEVPMNVAGTWTVSATGYKTLTQDATTYTAASQYEFFWLEQDQVQVTGVTLDKSEVTLTVGDEDVKLTATVLPDNATDKSVTWTSSEESVATVDNEGNVHAVAAGEATITVTTVDGNKTATCEVTVAAPETYTVTFDLNGATGTAPEEQTIASGGKVIEPDDPTFANHTFAGWYKTKDATTGALSDPWGFDTDTVTADMTLYAQWTIPVNNLPSTNPSFPTYPNAWPNGSGMGCAMLNGDLYLINIGAGTGNPFEDTDVAVKTGNDYIFTQDAITAVFNMTEGVLTSITITGFDPYNGTYAPPVSVTGVTLDKTEVTIEVGDEDVKLTATVLPDNATDKSVTWSSSDESVATVDNEGNVHAVAAGEATITVTTVDGNKTATCEVTVTAPAPTIKTIADVLALAPGGFPDKWENEIPSWKTESGAEMYIKDGSLIVEKNGSKESIELDSNLTREDGSDYYEVQEFAFFVTDDVLVAVKVKNFSSDLNGTYTPVVEGNLTLLPVNYVFTETQLQQYGLTDYNSFGYLLEGKNFKSARYYQNASTTIGNWTGSLEDLVNTYGADFTSDQINQINTKGYCAGGFNNKYPNTEYQLIVIAENIYGAKKTFTAKYTTASKPKTIADILETAEGGFPYSEQAASIPANAWKNGDKACFISVVSDAKALIFGTSYYFVSNDVEKSGDNYVYKVGGNGTITFVMTEGKLTSIKLENVYDLYDGTYAPPGTTFKAVYDTTGGANTLTFYYDNLPHTGDNITVYEGATLFDGSKNYGAKWSYNGIRNDIKGVKIDESVKNYHDLTSTTSMFQGMTAATTITGAEYLDVSNVTDMSLMFQNFGSGSINSHTTLNSVPDVSNWNTSNVTNMQGMFNSYGNYSDYLTKVPDVSNWNTSNVTAMSNMFQKYGYSSTTLSTVPDVSKWNTGNVKSMNLMFSGYGLNSTVLNAVPNVSGWKTGNVTDMSGMFKEYGKKSTVLKVVPDVSDWNTGNVTSMADMFNMYGYSSPALTKVPDVSGWSTANLKNLSNMFKDYGGLSTSGNITVESNVEFTLDLSGWDLTKLGKDKGTSLFNLKPETFNVTIPAKTGEQDNDATHWYYGDGTDYIVPASGKTFTVALGTTFKAVYDTTNDANTLTFYYDAVDHSGEGITVYNNLPVAATQLTDWGYNANRSNIKSVIIDESVKNYHGLTSTAWMFAGMTVANSISGAENLDVSDVANMGYMFYGCKALTSLDIRTFDTTNVTDMSHMFSKCTALESLNIANFNTSNVTNMTMMFDGCNNLTSLDVSNFNMSKVTNMSKMFSACKKLRSLCLWGYGDSVVTNMSNMFASCESLTALDFIDFDTSNVTDMSNMFQNCKKLQSLDLGGFNTEKVTDMGHMFENCECLCSLNISGFNTSSVNKMNGMFNGCSILTDLDLSEFTIDENTDVLTMFSNCSCLARVTIGANDKIENQLKAILNEIWTYSNGAYIAPGTITVAEILPANFPTDESEKNTWWKDNAEEYKVMLKLPYDELRVGDPDDNQGKSIAYDYVLKKDGNTYKGGYEGYKWIFYTEGGTLKEVVLEGEGPFAGTYAPPAEPQASTFSVSATKKVTFSPGNLQATIDANGNPTAWKFAAHQYDCIGEGGANKTIGVAGGDVDLFGWSTAATSYGISTSTNYSDYAGDFVDWGTAISGGNSWRTLTCDEWTYLVNTRTNASSLYKCGVTVCGKKCLIIAPDNWDISTKPLQSSYDEASWATAEADGLVCLPYAGYRNGSTVNDLTYGYYWTADAADENRANYTKFLKASIETNKPRNRNIGQSVRLVKDAE